MPTMSTRPHYYPSGGSKEQLAEQSKRTDNHKGRIIERATRKDSSKERDSELSTKNESRSAKDSRTVEKTEPLERRGVGADNRKSKGITVESSRRGGWESRESKGIASSPGAVRKVSETYGEYKRRKVEGAGGGESKDGDSTITESWGPEAKKYQFYLLNKDDLEKHKRKAGHITSGTIKVILKG
jgi:hypothetical protein